MKKYILNCFLLLLPILTWDLLLTSKLPAPYQPGIFQSEIPLIVIYGENISRTLLFIVTLLMPLSITSKRQKQGLLVYLSGLALYFSSWLALICFPSGAWSMSAAGFLAPAYTPLLWLTGIALTGKKFYFNFTYKPWAFICLSILFVSFHCLHAFIVYSRLPLLQ